MRTIELTAADLSVEDGLKGSELTNAGVYLGRFSDPSGSISAACAGNWIASARVRARAARQRANHRAWKRKPSPASAGASRAPMQRKAQRRTR